MEVNKKKFLFSEKAKKTGIAPKTSIFSRLGKEVTTATKSPSGPTITITGLGDLTLPESSTSQVCTQHMSLVVRKLAFCICENKDADQLCSNCAADQAFVFTIRIVQSLYFLNLKSQASSHLLWLYSPVCVGPGRKPRRPVFSQRGSYAADHEKTYFKPMQTTKVSVSELHHE